MRRGTVDPDRGASPPPAPAVGPTPEHWCGAWVVRAVGAVVLAGCPPQTACVRTVSGPGEAGSVRSVRAWVPEICVGAVCDAPPDPRDPVAGVARGPPVDNTRTAPCARVIVHGAALVEVGVPPERPPLDPLDDAARPLPQPSPKVRADAKQRRGSPWPRGEGLPFRLAALPSFHVFSVPVLARGQFPPVLFAQLPGQLVVLLPCALVLVDRLL